MRYFIAKFLQLSGMVTLAGALMAGLTEPTLWNELTLMLMGIVAFLGGWLIENRLPVGTPDSDRTFHDRDGHGRH